MDPITFSIIRHRLFRVIDEAVITLKHVSGSAITNEGHDLMVSLYRADGSLLMGAGWVLAALGPIIGKAILNVGEHGMEAYGGFQIFTTQ